MKIIKIVFLSLLALILLAGSGFAFLFHALNPEQYLLQISNKASFFLGRPVSIGHAGLGFSAQGITLDAGPVTITDDVNFTAQSFIKIDKVRASFDLGALVFQRKVRLKSILLESPQFHIIRSREGLLNVSSIGHTTPAVNDVDLTKTVVSSDSAGGMVEKSDAANRILNDVSIKIRDASISYIDQDQGYPLDIWINGINGSLDGYRLDRSKRSMQIDSLRIDLDLGQLDIKEINGIAPHISGIVQFNLGDLEIGASRALSSNGEISIAGGVIRNFNIIKTVLSHTLGVFGSISGAVDNLLNGPLKDKLAGQDTLIDRAQVHFLIHDRRVDIDDLLVQTDIFEFTAKGTMDQGLNLSLQTMLHLNNDVSTALINELDGLKLLRDDSDRIAIGASLNGIIPHLKYKLNKDFRKKSKRLLFEEGGNILGVLLGAGRS